MELVPAPGVVDGVSALRIEEAPEEIELATCEIKLGVAAAVAAADPAAICAGVRDCAP